MLIARAEEKKYLLEIINNKKSEFLALYGRRRVGKTHLIREVFSAHTNFLEIVGIKNSTYENQINRIYEALEKKFKISHRLERNNIKNFFSLITKEVENSKENFSLFIDELPWMSEACSDLLGEIDYFWNTEWCKLSNFKLIICGSATAWMIDNIINAKGGLYNRITKSLKLEPFNLKDTQEYLNTKKINYDLTQVLEIYLVFGGLPYYLDLIPQKKSPAQVIQELIFSNNDFLRDEAKNLFQALFKNHSIHEKIISCLAKKRIGLSASEISKITNTTLSTTIRALNELSESTFVREYIPFKNKKRGSYFRLVDEYLLFYFFWLDKGKKSGLKYPNNYWLLKRNSHQYYSWAGYSFESFCQKHSNQIVKALGISGMSTSCSTWRFVGNLQEDIEGCQIDLLIDRADRIINLVEIKYQNTPLRIDKKLKDEILKKVEIFKTKTKTTKIIVPVIVSASGFDAKNDSDFIQIELDKF